MTFFNYLDSIGFTLGGINFSLYLLCKAIIVAIAIFGLGKLLSRTILTKIRKQNRLNDEIKDLLVTIFQIVWYPFLILLALHLIGIDLKAFLLFGGALGVGIGIGLQKIAANFISGILLLFEQNVKVGHFIEIQGGNKGWIRHLGARAAILEIGDGKEIIVPNEDLISKTVIDWTYSDRKIRIETSFAISIDSDLEKVRNIVLEAVRSNPHSSKTATHDCFLSQFNDLGALFVVRFWIDDLTKGKEALTHEILLSIWSRFQKEGIKLETRCLN